MTGPLLTGTLGAMAATGPLVWPVARPGRQRAVRLRAASTAGATSMRTGRRGDGAVAAVERLARRVTREGCAAWFGAARPVELLAVGLIAGLLGCWACDAPVLVPLAVALVLWSSRRTRHARAHRTAARRRREVVELCTVLRTELVAGRSSAAALAEAVATCPDVADIAVSSSYGGEPVAALRRAAEQPGREGLRALAACWQVAASSGTGLVPAVTRVEHALRTDLRDRAELDAELGGVRTTAALLAGLPVLAIGLGGLAGGDPLRVLLHTPSGACCLLGGVLLELAGVTWVDRIATHATRRSA